MIRIKKRLVVIFALSVCMMLVGVPVHAAAETSDELQAELEVVQAHLNELYGEAEQVSEDLNETRVQLDTTNAQIDENTILANQKAEELAAAKQTLADVVSDDYRGGGLSMLSIILGSRSIEEFVSNLYYVNKVSLQRQEVITNVKSVSAELAETRATLEQEKAEQEQLIVQQEELQAELDANIAQTQDYVDGLSVQIQEALAAEEAARQEAARREAEAAAAAAAEQAAAAAAQQSNSQASSSGGQSQSSSSDSYSSSSSQSSSGSYSQSSSSSSGSGYYSGGQISGSVASTVINAACSQVGCAYVYGACSPGSAFDCSGLVMYAYACAGYSVPHSSGSLRAYCNKPISQAVPGDIVWRSGHVGIYIGGGTTVEAFYPGAGVGYGSVSSFLYAGSPAA